MMSTLKFNIIRKKAGNSDKKINLKIETEQAKLKKDLRNMKPSSKKKRCVFRGAIVIELIWKEIFKYQFWK